MKAAARGFTLIELIIVIVIIGILAAIAAPMMKGMTEKAIKAEAITALGTIRNAQRAYLVEYGKYASVTNFSVQNPLSAYISPGALNGTYFSENCYKIGDVDGTLLDAYRLTNDHTLLDIFLSEVGSTTGLLVCYSALSTAPRADKAINLKNFYMSQTSGYIFETDAAIIS